jgi:CRISPR-associated protein Csc2
MSVTVNTTVKVCPDCTLYGFAIGSEGSERSKVLVDSAFSLTDYDVSHQAFTFNAPYEHGTMSKAGETRSSFGEQDHVLPQIFFPSVLTLRDPTEAGFLYVLNNLLRTKRYGAQTTRTGTLENHLVAIVFADGEIFSNLKLTQTLYELLDKDEEGKPKKGPYPAEDLINKLEGKLDDLLKEDHVAVPLKLSGADLTDFLAEVNGLISDEAKLQNLLAEAYTQTKAYAEQYGARSRDKAAKGKGKTGAKGKEEGERQSNFLNE